MYICVHADNHSYCLSPNHPCPPISLSEFSYMHVYSERQILIKLELVPSLSFLNYRNKNYIKLKFYMALFDNG